MHSKLRRMRDFSSCKENMASNYVLDGEFEVTSDEECSEEGYSGKTSFKQLVKRYGQEMEHVFFVPPKDELLFAKATFVVAFAYLMLKGEPLSSY